MSGLGAYNSIAFSDRRIMTERDRLIRADGPKVEDQENGFWLWASERFGLHSAAEAIKVAYFFLSALLANSCFVLGRNVGPALFMKKVGAQDLTTAMFLSAVLTALVR